MAKKFPKYDKTDSRDALTELIADAEWFKTPEYEHYKDNAQSVATLVAEFVSDFEDGDSLLGSILLRYCGYNPESQHLKEMYVLAMKLKGNGEKENNATTE